MIHLHLTREAFKKVKDDKENIIECIVTSVSWLNYGHKNIDPLFYKYYPKYKGVVMQIDFEVV